MDPRKTAPFELGQGEDACLLLHGFTGSPWDVRPAGRSAGRARNARDGAPAAGARHHARGACCTSASATGRRRPGRRCSRCTATGRSSSRACPWARCWRWGWRPGTRKRVKALALIAPAARFKGPTHVALKSSLAPRLLEWAHPWVQQDGHGPERSGGAGRGAHPPGLPSARLRRLVGPCRRRRVADGLARALPHPGGGGRAGPRGGSGGRAGGSPGQLTASPGGALLSLQEGYHIIPRDTGGPRLASEVGGFLEQSSADEDMGRAGHVGARAPRSGRDTKHGGRRASRVFEPAPGSMTCFRHPRLSSSCAMSPRPTPRATPCARCSPAPALPVPGRVRGAAGPQRLGEIHAAQPHQRALICPRAARCAWRAGT